MQPCHVALTVFTVAWRDPTDPSHRLRRLLRGGHEQRKIPGAHSFPSDPNAGQRHGGQPTVTLLLVVVVVVVVVVVAVAVAGVAVAVAVGVGGVGVVAVAVGVVAVAVAVAVAVVDFVVFSCCYSFLTHRHNVLNILEFKSKAYHEKNE